VTSKLQVTIPKRIADQFAIKPGMDLDWIPAGDGIRVVPAGRKDPGADLTFRLKLFDEATARQRARQAGRAKRRRARHRGWTREDLYRRGRAD